MALKMEIQSSVPSLTKSLVLAAICWNAVATGRVIKVHVPSSSTSGRPLDPHLGSLSIESCYVADYFGEAGRRNELSWNLLDNFKGDFGGLNPYIRIGGHTQQVLHVPCPY